MRSANEDAKSYSSLDALRIAHNELLESLPDDETAPPDNERRAADARINEFLRSAANTGAYLDSPADRKVAQGLIDYWVASSYAASRDRNASRVLPDRADLVLKPFDSAKVAEAIERADEFIASLDTKEQELARRIVMHLVRLTGTGEPCRVAPQERNKLISLGSVQSADLIIERLAAIGVLRASKTDDEDRVELSYEALTRQWSRLREWINERQAFRGSVAAWEQGNKTNLDLSFNRSLLRQTEAYGDLNKAELEFKQKSERVVWWSTRIAWTLAAIALLTTLAAPGFWIWGIVQDRNIADTYRDKVWIVKKTESTGPQKLEAMRWLNRYQSRIPNPYFDFSNAKLRDLNFSDISLTLANFSNATFKDVILDNSKLRGARFNFSDISKSSFKNANLGQSKFTGAALSSADFTGAKLEGASFDRVRLCAVNFSGTDLRSASFRGVIFEANSPIPIFKNTVWWLATGWNLAEADQLNQFSYENLMKADAGFISATKEDESNVANSVENTQDRALALNGEAWTFAIYGVSLGKAEKAISEAITILNRLADKSPDEPLNKKYIPNFKDTLGYILLQQGKLDRALEELKQAASLAQDDPEIAFRYAVALNATGSGPNAIETLISSVATDKGNYSPSHELHLLKDYINGEFKTKLGELLDRRTIPGIPDPPQCSSDEKKASSAN
jgi:uncharacterized protein YjbI with pentapeptide repeats